MQTVFQLNPVYFVMATVGTGLFIIKMVLLLFAGDDASGIDSSDTGDLSDAAGHTDGGEAFTLISIQSILAFFMGTGWIGLAARQEWMWDKWKSLGAAAAFGFAMMFFSSWLTMKIKSLNSKGSTYNIKNAVGKTGRSYTRIPAPGEGMGQVEITVSDKQEILQAMSKTEAIDAFQAVRVVEVDDSGNLIIEKA